MLGFMKFTKRSLLAINYQLLTILLVALFLRLWGITHGLPHIYSVDEPALVRSVMGLRFDLNPHHFDWPHFHFYFGYLFFVLLVKFRALLQILSLRPILEPVIPVFWQDPQIFYLQLRVISALMGAVTVGLVYLIGKKLFDKKIGLWGAAFLAVYPFHNEISHFALLEAPLTFWITLSFLFSVLVFKRGRLRDYLLAGLFAGFAASTKYNGALVVVPIVVAHFLRVVNARRRVGEFGGPFRSFWRPLLAGLAAAAGFLLGTPYALLDWRGFWSREPGGFLWQMTRIGAVSWRELPRVLVGRSEILVSGLGVVLAALAILGVFLALVRRRRRDILLLSFPLVYFFYIGRLGFFNAHYFVPLAPFLSLLAAVSFWTLFERIYNFKFKKIFICFLLLQPLFLSARSSFIFSRPDTRQLASDWVAENIPRGLRIAKDGEYQPVLGGFDPIPIKEWSRDWFVSNQIDYIVVVGYDLSEVALQKKEKVAEVLGDFVLSRMITPRLRPGPTIMIFALDK